MHNPVEDYEWPACTACGKALWVDEAHAGRQACRPCEARTAQRLAELPALFTQLNTTAALMCGARRPETATTGSRVPPIPPRLEVLALTGPGGVAARLVAIEDAWRAALGRRIGIWAGSPAQAVPVHVSFLVINLQWACEQYESVGQDIDDIRRLYGEITAALSSDPKPGRVKIGLCPTRIESAWCATQLTASARSFKTECLSCGTAWEGEDEWRKLVEAQQQALAEAAGVHLNQAA